MKLVLNDNGRQGTVRVPTIVDFNVEPCPTITNQGIGISCHRGWWYWLEEGGTGPLNRVPSEGATVEDDPEAFGIGVFG